jgi:hypothetical protein
MHNPASSAADWLPFTREGIHVKQSDDELELVERTPGELALSSLAVPICTLRCAQLRCKHDEHAETVETFVLLVPVPSAPTVPRGFADNVRSIAFDDATKLSDTRDRYPAISRSTEAPWWREMGPYCVVIQYIWRSPATVRFQRVGTTFAV